MADSDERSSRVRKNTSGAASRRSGASPASLHRVPSSGLYLDDHAQYHGHSYRGEHRVPNQELKDDESTDKSDLTEKETKEEQYGDIIPEVRDGIEDQRDVEAGPDLEKSRTAKSGRSIRDPNLVAWDGPSDPKNPKNWTMGRKWAATLIG